MNNSENFIESRTAIGKADVFLVKYNYAGDIVWVRSWGGTENEIATDIAVDQEGYVYVVGSFTGSVDFNPGILTARRVTAEGINNSFLAKYDSDGGFKWCLTWGAGPSNLEYDAAGAHAVAVSNNSVYVAGCYMGDVEFDPNENQLSSRSNEPMGIFLSKFNLDGDFVWNRKWGGESGVFEIAYDLALDEMAGAIYVAGSFGEAENGVDFDNGHSEDIHFSNGGGDAFLCKYLEDGDYQWAHTWGSSSEDSWDNAYSVSIDSTGNVYVSGSFDGTIDFDPGPADDIQECHGIFNCYICKFDAGGIYKWTRTWGGSSREIVTGLYVRDDYGVFTTGVFDNQVDFDPSENVDSRSSNGGFDVFLSNFDLNGQYKWAITLGDEEDETCWDIVVDQYGNRYVGGFHIISGNEARQMVSHGYQDCFIIKIANTEL